MGLALILLQICQICLQCHYIFFIIYFVLCKKKSLMIMSLPVDWVASVEESSSLSKQIKIFLE